MEIFLAESKDYFDMEKVQQEESYNFKKRDSILDLTRTGSFPTYQVTQRATPKKDGKKDRAEKVHASAFRLNH